MKEVSLTKEEKDFAYACGKQRAEEMADSPDKAGSLKKGEFHTPVQADALGIAAEIAACKMLGVDYMDRGIYVPFAKKVNGRLPAECKQPDILGKYEIRRVEKFGTPIKMWQKDHDAAAYVIQAIVEHEHLANGKIVVSGNVQFLAWQDAVEDWKKKQFWEGYYFLPQIYRRPMSSLPMPVGVAA